MGPARIYPWRKMHRSRAPSIAPGTFVVAQPWADCITNMPGFNLRQAQRMEDLFVEAPSGAAAAFRLLVGSFLVFRLSRWVIFLQGIDTTAGRIAKCSLFG